MVQNLFPISSFFKIKFMFKHIFYAALLLISATITQCGKTTVDPNGLPPATQTGTGTFACLINGAVWQYKNADNFYTSPKTRWEFDPNYLGGYLYVGATRYSDGVFENDALVLVADSLLFKKDKDIKSTGLSFGIEFFDYKAINPMCREISSSSALDSSKNFYSIGKLTITKLDQTTRIIAGNFYCTIKQTGCDTMKITDGRFDLKY